MAGLRTKLCERCGAEYARPRYSRTQWSALRFCSTACAFGTTAERFWEKVDRSGGTDACWPWLAFCKPQGYGQFAAVGRRPVLAHRYAYAITVGPIPTGLTLDHLCRNKGCVNPRHLEPVTSIENHARWARLRTACNAGHTYTAASSYFNRDHGRRCRICRRLEKRPSRRAVEAVTA